MGAKRLEKLHKGEFYIEALMVHGQLLEHVLRGILYTCWLKAVVAEEVGAPEPLPVIRKNERQIAQFHKDFADFKKKPLGKIIGLFREATGETELADKSESFNKIRIKMVHQAFNGIEDIDEVNKAVSIYLKTADLGEIVDRLSPVETRIREEIKALYPKLNPLTPEK